MKKKMPSYMVPFALIQVEDFPITANGKLDIKKLSATTAVINNHIIKEPQNNIQINLLKIFKALLQEDDISIDDDFFELGGDSLSAIKLSVEIYNEFNKNITVKEIFDNSSVEKLSLLINNNISTQNINIIKISEQNDYILSSAQKRIYLSSSMAGENSILYNTSGGIILDKKPDVKKLENCLSILN